MLHTQPMAPPAPASHPTTVLEALERKAQAQLALYRSEPNRMLSDFNRERELIGEYNGRQLLEMLQNADDQGSKRVLVEWDEAARRLAISNEGAPFSAQGFESLMLSNLSTKTGGGYIGNKGLGFRSIVNWASEIAIGSGGLNVTFAERIVRSAFARMFTPDEQDALRAQRKLAMQAVPMAFLSVPELRTAAPGDWTTTIAIVCREAFVEDIRTQLDELTPQCLLFLNHIDRIEIRSDGHSRVLEREVDGGTVTINGQPWTIHALDLPLPGDLRNQDKAEPERYSLKLALAPDLRDGARTLYTFFPTRVGVNFPMVVHGTFELDASRNQLIVSKRNEYILEQLVKLIVDTAQGLGARGDGWQQVRLMRYGHPNPVLADLGFYELIDGALRELPLFPCVDGVYRRMDEVYYLDEEFSNLVAQVGAGASFPGLVRAGPENEHYAKRYRKLEQIPDFAKSIRMLSEALCAHHLDLRVRLIAILDKLDPRRPYAVLVNGRNQVLNEHATLFTRLTAGNEKFHLPEFVNIDFMHEDLHEKLVKVFTIAPGAAPRVLEQRLSGIADIHSFEPAQVYKRIVTASTAALGEPGADMRGIIVQTVAALFANYRQVNSKGSLADENMRLFDRAGNIRPARDLVLSQGYPDGRHTERLFARVYDDAMLLAPPEAFGDAFAACDPMQVQEFFIWLGVGRYVRYVPAPRHISSGYEAFVFRAVDKPDAYRHGEYNGPALQQGDLERICIHLSPEQIVEWLLRDMDARERLELNNPDEFKYSRVRDSRDSNDHKLVRKPSFLLYQLRQLGLFDDFLITDDATIAFVNDIPFNYTADGFKALRVERGEIGAVLLRLGAKLHFSELSLERIAAVLRHLPISQPEGRQAQKLYRLALNRFDRNRECLPGDVHLLARRGGETAYRPQCEVHYADNSRLPRRIADQLWLLSYPRRAGAQKVPEFFRVHNANALDVKVEHAVPLDVLTAQCEAHLEPRKPLLLAYRIENLDSDKRDLARKLASFSLTLCSELICVVRGERVALAPNDYVKAPGSGWHFKVCVASGLSLEGLRRDSAFCDAFADIVGSVFDVAEHQAEFRAVFKDPFDDVVHVANERLTPEMVAEARVLLEALDPRADFLAALVRAKGDIQDDVELAAAMRALTGKLVGAGIDLSALELALPVDAVNAATLRRIFEVLDVSPQAFDAVAQHKLHLGNYHRTRLESARNAAFHHFKHALVKRLSGQDWTARGRLLEQLHDYERDDDWISAAVRVHADDFDIDVDMLLAAHVHDRFGALQLVTVNASEPPYEEMHRRRLLPVAAAGLSLEQASWLYFEGGLEQVNDWLAAQPIHDEALAHPDGQAAPAGAALPAQSATPIAGMLP